MTNGPILFDTLADPLTLMYDPTTRSMLHVRALFNVSFVWHGHKSTDSSRSLKPIQCHTPFGVYGNEQWSRKQRSLGSSSIFRYVRANFNLSMAFSGTMDAHLPVRTSTFIHVHVTDVNTCTQVKSSSKVGILYFILFVIILMASCTRAGPFSACANAQPKIIQTNRV